MNAKLKDELRHAGVGFLLGLLGLAFGVFWAVYLTVNHEAIHGRLLKAQTSSIEEKFVLNSGAGHSGHAAEMDHAGHAEHDIHAGHEPAAIVDPAVEQMRSELAQIKQEIAERNPSQGRHGSPEMAEAHGRLAKGHVHAMGLGIMTIAVSMLLAFVPASPRAKTFAAACVGTGGLFYPLSWIVMGMRTTALGSAGAQGSVLPMVALSVALTGLGLLLALVYTVRWLVRG